MARPQVREVSSPERIQGIASPVSTYVRPADPAASPLHELAEGLASMDTRLRSFLDQRKQDTDEADKARAITDFHRNNQKGYADAVREGLIPATASKSYVEWYKKQQGHLAGLKLSDKFSIDYQQWDGRDSEDPAAFGQFVSGWMTQNIGQEQDPNILAGLAPHLDRIASGGYDTFNQERAASLRSKAQATSGAIVTDTLMRGAEAGRVEGSVDYDGLWTGLMSQREEAVSKGERGEDFDKLMVDSIILQAEESGDSDMLKLLDRATSGSDLPMAKNPEVREKRMRALERIGNKQASMATDQAQLAEKQDKRRHEDKLAEAVLILSNGEDVPEETIRELSRRDGEIRYKLAKYKKEYGDLDTAEDPQDLMQVYEEIDDGAGRKYVLDMREKGVIRDPATFLKAMDRVDAVKKATQGGGIFTSPTYKDTVKFITNETGYGDMSVDGLRGLSSEGMEALYDYRNMLLEWDLKNPDAGLLEREKQAREAGEFIRSRFQEATDPKVVETGVRSEYVSEADAAKAKEEPQELLQEQDPEVPAQTQEEDGGYLPQPIQDAWDWLTGGDEEEAAPPQSQEQSSWVVIPYETLSDSTKQSLEAFAKKKGLSVEEAYGIISGRAQKLSGETPAGVDPTTTNSISPATRDKLFGLLQDPPKVERLTASNVPVGPLLGLIGHTEGTDKGDGYNETLGYGAYTGGDVNLVGMTLGEIDKLQTQMLRHPNNSWNSSAIGRYQIIRTTMRKLKKTMGLTDDVLFSPELQDQMAMQLLEGRGLSKWQAGKMSDEQFMSGLSAEWASLPKANGKGSYRNQRVGTSTAGVRGVLDKVRNAEVASLDPSIGMSSGSDPYANIPDVDASGNAGQKQRFLEWNPDPVGNHEANLQSIDAQLGDVVRRAQAIAGVKFVVGSGKRDDALQKKAVEWGWSKTEDSDHEHGAAVDLWPIDENGAVKFDPAMQQEVVMAMKLAAKELGVDLDIGAEWKSFKDKPHFGIKHK
ncbi:UNVERIFIED_ORG: M15 family metallopeptidase [Roseateles sp. XES5]|nr:M15 family metallopeptidase [Roseateles sp. XES5]